MMINMQRIEAKEAQVVELEILKYIRDICDNNGLKYFLAYGTLLGAIRHKGFIPWDDDIDIFMPRDDYLKLVEICKKKPHQYYRIISFETNNKFTNALPKMIDTRTLLIQNLCYIERVELGVYVDIFILDGIGNSYREALRNEKKGIVLERKWCRADMKLFPPNSRNKVIDVLRWIRNAPFKLMGITYYVKKIIEFSERRSFYDNKYVSRFCFENLNKAEQQIWEREWFDDSVDAEFENEKFKIPIGYDAFLKSQYHNYMELPPKEKQVSNHDYVAYWR